MHKIDFNTEKSTSIVVELFPITGIKLLWKFIDGFGLLVAVELKYT